MSQYTQVFLGDGTQIRCEHRITESRPQGSPVLSLEGPCGVVTIFLGMERLERLHAAIGAYLAAHRRPVPAEAATGSEIHKCPDCGHPTNAFPRGERCFHCGRWIPAAEAAVDVDELITSIFE